MYRVMIVDNDPLMRRALAAMIGRTEGFDVVHSLNSGAEAVRICREEPLDIVFLDLIIAGLPGLPGLTAADHIRRLAPNVALIIASAHTSFELAAEAMRLNVKKYLSKPLSPAAVSELLAEYRASHKAPGRRSAGKLLPLVKSRDFNRVYYDSRQVAAALRAEADHDLARLRARLLQIGEDLIDPLGGSSADPATERLFFPDAALLSMTDVVEIWLFLLLDRAFRRNSVHRHPFLAKVFNFIDSNITLSISLKDIVDNCFVSQGHLSRVFKKDFNVSVMDYLHMKKISLARAYFIFTEHSASEVAFRLGYNESGYFSKVFKKYEKITIQSYRRVCARPDNQAALAISQDYEVARKLFGVEDRDS